MSQDIKHVNVTAFKRKLGKLGY